MAEEGPEAVVEVVEVGCLVVAVVDTAPAEDEDWAEEAEEVVCWG